MPDYNSPYTGVQVDAAVGKAIAITATPAEINAAVQKVGGIISSAEDIDNTVDIITDNGASDGDILTATGDGGVEYRTPAPVSWDDINDKPTTYPPSEHQHEISNIIGLVDDLDDKVDKVSGKGLSSNDYTTADKNKLTGIEAGAEVNEIDTIEAGANVSVTKTGKTVTISASGGGASTWNNISGKPFSTVGSGLKVESDTLKLDGNLDDKVDKVSGKGLSSNDYTTADKNKLTGIEAGAEVNEIDTIEAGANVTVTKSGKTVTISASGGGSDDYNDLDNKPQIAGTTLSGNKSLADLGIASSSNLSSLSGRVDLIDTAYGEAIDNLDERLQDAVSDIALKYTKPSSGIPKDDLASAVQTSLGRADSALQSVPSTYRTAAAQDIIDNGKVDKVSGKGLSTNDYTTTDKNRVAAFAALGIPVPTRADAGKVLGVNASGQYALISTAPQRQITLAGVGGTPTSYYVKSPTGTIYYESGDTFTAYDGETVECQAYWGPDNWIKLNGVTVAEGAPAIYNLVVTDDATVTFGGAPGSGGQMTIVMG